MIPCVHSGIFTVTLNNTCRWSKRSANKKILSIVKVVTFEATPKFWGAGDWRKWCKEGHAEQEAKPSLSALLLFLNQFMCFFLLFILHHSEKLAMSHYYLLLLLQILHRVLFKSLQHKGELSISGDSRIVFWWDRDGNHAYHFWGDLIHHFFGTNVLRSVYFCPSVAKSYPPRAATIRRAIDLVDG